VISPSRIALACTSLCLTVATIGAQTVRQCPVSERQAALARPVVATGFVAAAYEALQSACVSKRLALTANFAAPSESRCSLDCSGQTDWFSADIRRLLGLRAPQYWPSLLRLSAGHPITDYVDQITGASLYHFPSPALQLAPGARGISRYR
jgi:hypothetical protein